MGHRGRSLRPAEQQEQAEDAEERARDDGKACSSAAAESEPESRGDAVPRGVRDAHVRTERDEHPPPSRCGRARGADDEGDRRAPCGVAARARAMDDEHGDGGDDRVEADGSVLAPLERVRSFPDRIGDGGHLLRTGAGSEDLARKGDRRGERHRSCCQDEADPCRGRRHGAPPRSMHRACASVSSPVSVLVAGELDPGRDSARGALGYVDCTRGAHGLHSNHPRPDRRLPTLEGGARTCGRARGGEHFDEGRRPPRRGSRRVRDGVDDRACTERS